MENAKSVKALKKQLVAAIAMVLVAAVALASSTYAWFVSNNKVTAKTTSISAQSNSAYLLIEAGKKTTADSTTAATGTEQTTGEDTKLYPAQWAKNFAEDKTATGEKVYQFESAYAEKKDVATEKTGTRFAVGTPAEAVTADYALLNTFYVGTGTYDGEFENLRVSNMEVTTTEATKGLKTGMRLLIMAYKDGEASPTSWVVAKYNDGATAAIEANSDGTTSDIVYKDKFGKTNGDVKIEIYAYYDGADENVKTTNLSKLVDCSATATFTATPTEYGK